MKIERKKNQAANTDRWKEAHTEEEAHSTCDILKRNTVEPVLSGHLGMGQCILIHYQ